MHKLAFDHSSKFLDPQKILFAVGIANGQTLADLGAGSGFYSLTAGKLVGEQGLVYSVDILDSALGRIASEARVQGIKNIKTMLCDLEQARSCQQIPTGSVDVVLMANSSHQITNLNNLFAEAYRLLKTGGKLLVIEWNEEPSVLGPASKQRISSQEVRKTAAKATLKEVGTIPADTYHYGLVFIK